MAIPMAFRSLQVTESYSNGYSYSAGPRLAKLLFLELFLWLFQNYTPATNQIAIPRVILMVHAPRLSKDVISIAIPMTIRVVHALRA